MKYLPHELAAVFDRRLGDPHDPLQAFSYARCADLDEREEFPTEICRLLDELGLARHYVPTTHGGALDSYEDLAALLRTVARRDLTVAIAHVSTFLGAASVWLAGERAQADRLAAEIHDGSVVSLALTEQQHGSDLLANRLATAEGENWYRVNGEKWLIGNASRGQFVCVLARTDPAGGPRGFSLLLIDKRQLAPGSFRCLPAVRTVGIRGADISGIEFTEAEIPATAVVGEAGTGLETVLKILQLTRSLCGPLSLGTGDHALRLAVRYSLDHLGPADGSPTADRRLTEAYADLLVAEAVTLAGIRSIHALTGELSVVSAAVKCFVPHTVEQLIADLGTALGAGVFLSRSYLHGAFQKLERDHHIMSIFDGNTFVNLNALINQFPQLAVGHRRRKVDESGLAAAVDLQAELPPHDGAALELISRTGSSLVQSLPAALTELTELAARRAVPAAVGRYADELREITDELHAAMADHRPSARDVPPGAFDLARRWTQVFAAAACVQLWLRNRDAAADSPTAALWADGLWLEAGLARLLAKLRPGVVRDGAVFDRLSDRLHGQYRDGELFSLLHSRMEETV
ncbi:acyl-CoA dehydrogenase family protein [Kitasatospora sp. MBT63]|uniref:acyl-CoA dehydrogenase family protein n=1 Tax=Kitasatospora sp. MBT63 TaxID=1444768 RepID=UPI00053A485C|nr:acyl-CoA dehydrogenase family protein [Kitasatospora sp. MBT63]